MLRIVCHILVFSCILFLLACNTKHGKGDTYNYSEEDIKQQIADSLFTQLKHQTSLYTDWQKTYQQKEPFFSLDSFNYRSEYNNDFIYTVAKLNKDYYKKYGAFFVYNADSTKFIDAFSYYLVITIDKRGHLWRGGTEADQEVAVIDIKAQKRYRVFFCGTPCFVAKTVWIGDDKIALMGLTTEEDEDDFIPTIWLINLKKASTIEYSYSKHIRDITPEMLLDELVKNKGIKSK